MLWKCHLLWQVDLQLAVRVCVDLAGHCTLPASGITQSGFVWECTLPSCICCWSPTALLTCSSSKHLLGFHPGVNGVSLCPYWRGSLGSTLAHSTTSTALLPSISCHEDHLSIFASLLKFWRHTEWIQWKLVVLKPGPFVILGNMGRLMDDYSEIGVTLLNV